jgi:16S rRNA (adenine1518-N6/adenine1519-N6)-dimethyltransferase
MKYNKIRIGAKRELGQNFLIDRGVIEKIILAIPKSGETPIVEIGSGLGDLTKELLSNARRVIAYEVDSRLCRHLDREFRREIASKKLELRCGDVLSYWREMGSLLDEPYHLVANLPYYIATKIIIKAMEDSNCKSSITMVQREVAKKFASNSGSREFCSLSVIADSCGERKVLFDVLPEAFNPPPKVVSSVLEIKKCADFKRDGFDRFLKVAFTQPRKRLFKNLSSKYAEESLLRIFKELSLKSSVRPHQVETRIYHLIYNQLKEDIDGERDNRFNDRKKSNSVDRG